MRALSKLIERWRRHRYGANEREIVLVRRRVYMLPTRFGVLFGVMLLLMLSGSVNYALGLGYVLTFLLAALSVSTILHTFRNLAGLRVTTLRTTPVFAGDVAHFQLCIDNAAGADRCSLTLVREKRELAII